MDDPTSKSSAYTRLVRARFLTETAHLGPEKQKMLARALQAGHAHREARRLAEAAIAKAAAK